MSAAASASVPPFRKTSAAGSVASHIVRDPMPAPPHLVIASAKATYASHQALSAGILVPADCLNDVSAAFRPRLYNTPDEPPMESSTARATAARAKQARDMAL